ncbi:trypsin-like serine protease [Gordonia lacunae]|uniref:trypsin-like serine protease n=1 Tax=Gordonia lacunae TaxID=417102 RepID=UPI001FC95C94|nr:trypsin-like serine protease [Gordonia lacunae]
MKRWRLLGVLVAATGLAAVGVPAATADAATTTVRSGMKITVDETIVTSTSCTLGAVISTSKALTAGHCGNVGQVVYSASGARVGTITANRITRQLDIAVITLAPRVASQQDAIDWDASFWRGQAVSKAGITTGYGQGVITEPRPVLRRAYGFSLAPPFVNQHATYSVDTTLRSEAGDSGAGVRDGRGRVVGILSSGDERSTAIAPVSKLPRDLR